MNEKEALITGMEENLKKSHEGKRKQCNGKIKDLIKKNYGK